MLRILEGSGFPPFRNMSEVNDQKSKLWIPHQFSALGYVNIIIINGRMTYLNEALQAQSHRPNVQVDKNKLLFL